MKPFQLTGTSQDGKKSSVWCCGVCMHTCQNEAHAKRCCTCSYCGQEVPPDKYGNRQSYHRDCQRADWSKREVELMEKAAEVADYDGPFLVGGDAYYETMDDVLEHFECHYESESDWPEFIYACKERKPCLTLSLDDLSHKIEDLWEDADWDDFRGVAELEAALEAFNTANADSAVYHEDRTRKVRVPKPAEAAGEEGEK